MNRAVKYTVIAVVGAAALAFIAYRIIDAAKPPAPKKQPIPLVKTEAVRHEDVTYKLDYEGDVLPALQANIFSRVSGMLEGVYTDMGKTVSRNQLIALVDTAVLYQSERQAYATYVNARVTEGRTRDLASRNLAAQQDLDNAVAALRAAEATYESAKTQLDFAKVRSPFHGYVTKRYLDPGSVVSSTPTAAGGASTIFTIMDIDTVKIDVNVLDRDIPQVHPGMRAAIRLDAAPGREYVGYVSRSAQAINTTTRTMPVEIIIPNRDESLKPGAFARVTLVLGQHPQAMTLPSEAILHDNQSAYVLAVENQTAVRKNVEIGSIESGRTEILSGLDGTEQIITTGQNFAKPNGKVNIINSTSKDSTTRKDSTNLNSSSQK